MEQEGPPPQAIGAEGGFTRPVRASSLRLAQRCWTLHPSFDDWPAVTPEAEAANQMEKLRGWVASDPVYAAWCRTKSDRAVAERCLRRASSRWGADFVRRVRDEMDRLGLALLLSDLRAAAAAAAPSSTKGGAEEGAVVAEASAASAAANISHTLGGSRTARVTCCARAAAHALGFGPDHLARLFVEPAALERMAADAERFRLSGELPHVREGGGAGAVRELQARRPLVDVNLVSFLQARTCMGDDTVARFIDVFSGSGGGLLQPCNLVVLGAGYDTRCYRLALPAPMRLWEVDAPGTQAYKVGVLARCAVPGRERVTFVSVDFASGADWVTALSAAGCDLSAPSCLLWEGVTMYLPPAAVTATLRSISALPGPAVLFFDYLSPALVAAMRGRMAAAGEPWLFGAEPGEVEALCALTGLRVVDHLSTADLVPACMPTLAGGGSVGFGSTTKRFVVAVNAAIHNDIAIP